MLIFYEDNDQIGLDRIHGDSLSAEIGHLKLGGEKGDVQGTACIPCNLAAGV